MRADTPELRAAQANLSPRQPDVLKPDLRLREAAASAPGKLRELRREAKIAHGREIVETYEPANREFHRLMKVQAGRGLTQQEHGEAEEWQAIMDAFNERYGPAWGPEYDAAKRAYKKHQKANRVVPLEALRVAARGG